jgi:pentose-5-phosphate-3-epimerase
MDEPWAYVPQTIAGKWERRSIPKNIYVAFFGHIMLQTSQAIIDRILAEEPARICDDIEIWDTIWREIAAENREWAKQWL